MEQGKSILIGGEPIITVFNKTLAIDKLLFSIMFFVGLGIVVLNFSYFILFQASIMTWNMAIGVGLFIFSTNDRLTII